MKYKRVTAQSWWKTGLIGTFALAIGVVPAAQARITHIVISNRVSPALGGASFGSVGPYEELDGTAYGEVDPTAPENAVIQDIALAPRNKNGMVEYSMDISILKPVDEGRGNHVLLYDVVNRGNKIVTSFFNVGVTADNPAGDGFLENRGYTLVWSGWQGDLVPATGQLGISVPVAHAPNGGTITATVRGEFVTTTSFTARLTTQNLTSGSSSGTPGYPTVSLDNTRGVLTQRVHQYDPPQVVATSDWAFADCTSQPFPGVPNRQKLCLKNGFDPNQIYELFYQAQDPLVLGLGLAATRDFVSFLRNTGDASQNPLASAITAALAHGTSQSGRWLRTYLDLGFNQDEAGRTVFEGMNPHIASVRGSFNIRFGTPGRLAGTEHTEKQYPGPDFPFAYRRTFDPLTGETAGLLDNCRQSRTCPKIVHVMSGTEYWEASGSLDTTDPSGRRDLPELPDTRIYQMASTQHGGFSPVAPIPTSTGICQQLPNVNSYTYILRDLLVRLTAWVTDGKSPPPSQYSRIDDSTLVAPAQVRFPTIPGVNYTVGTLFNTNQLLWRGLEFNYPLESGIMQEPPIPIAERKVLLPQVDGDGNEIGGVRSTTLQAPLGTYTAWNPRAAGFSQGDACDLVGSYIPFAVHASERAAGDPRLSLEERYGDQAGYVAAVAKAAGSLVQAGLLLPDDAATIVSAAKASNVLQ